MVTLDVVMSGLNRTALVTNLKRQIDRFGILIVGKRRKQLIHCKNLFCNYPIPVQPKDNGSALVGCLRPGVSIAASLQQHSSPEQCACPHLIWHQAYSGRERHPLDQLPEIEK